MITEAIRTEPWHFGPERRIVLPRRREQLKRAQQLNDFITANRFGRVKGFTRLRTPNELAKLGREQGHDFKPMEIEYAAARAMLAIGEPVKY